MVGKKFILGLVSLMSFVLLLSGCSSKEESSTGINIGITQIVEHPALDLAREGFIKALEDEGFVDGENINIEVQNAQGDIPTTQTIANRFVSNKKDLILAIATPAAQSAYNATKDIPILFTAVTDPVKAGLVKSLEKSQTNVVGTSDLAPIRKQLELLKSLVPNVKTVGFLYNTSEANSEIQLNMAKEIVKDLGLEIKEMGVTNTNEVSQALDSIISDIDALYVPTDNTIASAVSLVTAKCNDKKIPVIGAEEAHVNKGALATEGIDYFKLGYQTGKMAVKVLNGENPSDMETEILKDTDLVINKTTCELLDIKVSDELKKTAKFVESEK